jgi:hypothetical protein
LQKRRECLRKCAEVWCCHQGHHGNRACGRSLVKDTCRLFERGFDEAYVTRTSANPASDPHAGLRGLDGDDPSRKPGEVESKFPRAAANVKDDGGVCALEKAQRGRQDHMVETQILAGGDLTMTLLS